MLQPAGARRLLCASQGRLIVTLWSPWSADFRDEVFSGLSCHVLLCFDLSVIPEGDTDQKAEAFSGVATCKVSGLPLLSCSCPPEGGDEPPAGSQVQAGDL